MTIYYYKKEVYGNTLLYVKDPSFARMISKLTGKKTIDSSDILALEGLGVKFEQVLN